MKDVDSITPGSMPVTALVATRNEAANLERCLGGLRAFARRVVIDSGSTDGTREIAIKCGAEVVDFAYGGGYPKKRQWALDTLDIRTPWVLLVDADELAPPPLVEEIRQIVTSASSLNGYLVTKGFHFLGKRFRFGGFSHSAVALFRTGRARFEHLIDEPADALDMEVHERLIVEGAVGQLRTPLLHEDFKGLEAYLARHNRYSTWEAQVRRRFRSTGQWGGQSIEARLFGDVQQRRRWLKRIAVSVPCEPLLWFLYHYLAKLGILEGRRGLIACQIRAQYIAQVRAKMYEESLRRPVMLDEAR